MNGRLVLLLTLLVSWVLGIFVRLYGVQIADHERYAARAASQQQREVTLAAPRGTIRDARGRTLAVSVEVDSVAADPREVEEPALVAAQLAVLLGHDREETEALNARLSSDRHFVWIARKPDIPVAEAVKQAELPGVFLLRESRRFYPLRALAAQVLGFVGTDNVGLGGLEALYDRVVASEPGRRVVLSDGRNGRAVVPGAPEAAPRAGDDLGLTLDAAIQHVAERELAAAIRRTNAKRGSIVVLDPSSGAVLAMAGLPSFDPNAFAAVPRERLRNPVVTDAFEPGSTFKMVTLAAAMEQGKVRLDDAFDCQQGALVVHGRRIRDHTPFGVLSARQVMAKSSNVGAMKIGFAAGRQALYGTIRGFGFGEPTGIDLPGESAGLLRPLDRWGPLTSAYVSFGQGMSATLLQLASAFGVIANGGKRIQPYVVATVGDREVGPDQRRPTKFPVAPSTVGAVRSALESVVVEGTGGPASVAGFRVAGKTGTAQKAAGASGYLPNKYIASFIGFVPADDPALVIGVAIDEPWPLYHGSQAAAPVFAAVAQQTLLYLGIAPQREPPQTWPGEAEGSLVEAAPLQSRGVGIAARDIAEVEGTMPDFSGATKRQALRRAGGLGLRADLHGSGFVARQVPPPGTPLEVSGYAVELWFSTQLSDSPMSVAGRTLAGEKEGP